MSSNPLMEVKGIKKYFPIKKGILNRVKGCVKAVDNISFSVFSGETLGIVGESGCGKSTTGRILVNLIDASDGDVIYKGTHLRNMTSKQIRLLRKELQIVFQDPYSSLNPRMSIGQTIREPMDNFKLYSGKEKRLKVEELLEKVGLGAEAQFRYPHEFSGGQRQRIGIARALAVNPKLIVADEPVSALDVSVQSQILNLLKELQEDMGLTYVFITHDLSVVSHFCDRIIVMYLGHIVEIRNNEDLFDRPLHPYTRALLSSAPVIDNREREKKERIVLNGDVPSPSKPPSGCAFHTRCPHVMDICKKVTPRLQPNVDGHLVACHLYNNENKDYILEV